MNLTGAIIKIKINGNALNARVVAQEGTSFIVDVPSNLEGRHEINMRFFIVLNFFEIIEMPKVPDWEARWR